MSVTRKFFVLPFRMEGKKLAAGQRQAAQTREEAISRARSAAQRAVGVVAFECDVDDEVSYWGDPIVLFSAGTVPDLEAAA